MHTKFAKRVTTASRSFTRTILDLTAQSDVISFAGGLPDAALFPRQSIQKWLYRRTWTPKTEILGHFGKGCF